MSIVVTVPKSLSLSPAGWRIVSESAPSFAASASASSPGLGLDLDVALLVDLDAGEVPLGGLEGQFAGHQEIAGVPRGDGHHFPDLAEPLDVCLEDDFHRICRTPFLDRRFPPPRPSGAPRPQSAGESVNM